MKIVFSDWETLAKIQVSEFFHMRDFRRKDFSQIYRALYGDAMSVPIQMGTNMAAGNQQKHLSLSLLRKRELISRDS